MKFAIIALTMAVLASCAPTRTTLNVGAPWNEVAHAARSHSYEIGDTNGFAFAQTLFDAPPGITLDLEDDSILILFPDDQLKVVESIAIYRNISRAKIERDWLELVWFDLTTRRYALK